METALQSIAGLESASGVDIPVDDQEDSAGVSLFDQMDAEAARKAAGIAAQTLRELEKIVSDSKVSALARLLDQIHEGEMESKRVCVLTDYLDTLYYLAAELEDRRTGYQLLHGSLSTETRQRSLSNFFGGGGILVATRAIMTPGVNMRETTDLVLYDTPESTVGLQNALGRFDRVGRTSQLRVHVLVATNRSDDRDSQSLQLLREILGPNSTGTQTN